MKGYGRALILVSAVASLGLVVLLSLNIAAHRGDSVLHSGTAGPDPLHDPPILGELPDFNLTERADKPITAQQLRGKVWVADFVFTHCAGPCPMMTQRMADLQRRLRSKPGWSDIRLVSFSVDPQRDTPEVLREYAKQFDADKDQWLFVTGAEPTIRGLTRDGFKLPVGDNEKDNPMPIYHSTRFVLVDRGLRIRGYYDGLDNDGIDKLNRDLDRVLEEKNLATDEHR